MYEPGLVPLDQAALLSYLQEEFSKLAGELKNVSSLQMASYTVANVPSAALNPRTMIYVSNEVGGAVPAFSDGTNWRRVTDRAIIS